MILSAQTIQRVKPLLPIRQPYIEHGMSGGLGPAGYDISVEFDKSGLFEELILTPKCPIQLCSSVEFFCMPNNVLGMVCDKSSWVRKGLVVQNTVIEPGWSGYLTLELTNESDTVIIVKRGVPIAQVVFQFLDEPTDRPYGGKYQDQARGPQQAKT